MTGPLRSDGDFPVAPETTDALEASSLALAASLSALGYGLFAWLQPGELEAIHPMQALPQVEDATPVPWEETAGHTAAGPSAEAEVGHDVDPEREVTGAGHDVVPDTRFDEDLAVAALLESVALNGTDPGDPPVASTPPQADASQEPSSYATPRVTIAMLEEIAFLDE